MRIPTTPRLFVLLLAAVALVVTTLPAAANPPADPISIDRASPSLFLCANPKTPADIYGEVMAGAFGQGCDGFPAVGPIVHVKDFNYGLTPGDEQDGHSINEREVGYSPNDRFAIYFSVDRASVGAPGTAVNAEAANRQAAGDRYVSFGFTARSPAAAFAACTPTVINQAIPGPRNQLSLNQTGYNLIPSIGPGVFNPGDQDNADALELFPFDFNGDKVHDRDVYFTVAPNSPSYPLGADVLRSPAGAPGFGVWATAGQLGLRPDDNVDALVVFNMAGGSTMTPGTDYVLFSLDWNSPTTTTLGLPPSTVLVSDGSGTFCVYLKPRELGLVRSRDNIDALDVERGAIEIFEDQVGTPTTD